MRLGRRLSLSLAGDYLILPLDWRRRLWRWIGLVRRLLAGEHAGGFSGRCRGRRGGRLFLVHAQFAPNISMRGIDHTEGRYRSVMHGRAGAQDQACKKRNKTGPFHVRVGFGFDECDGIPRKNFILPQGTGSARGCDFPLDRRPRHRTGNCLSKPCGRYSG